MTAPYVVPESVRRLWGVPTTNDLPPKWDGIPITWHGWTSVQSSIDWHLPVDQTACDKCGGLGEGTLINWGSRTVDGHPTRIRDLWVARCPHCGYDTVHDERTGQHWDLETDDYGDEGSTETKDTLF